MRFCFPLAKVITLFKILCKALGSLPRSFNSGKVPDCSINCQVLIVSCEYFILWLELVILNNNNKSDRQVYAVNEFKMTKQEGNNYTFEVELEPDEAGAYRIAVRMFPKNKDLPHRQDICYVKWLD